VHPDSEDGAAIAAVFRERTRDEWTAFAGEHDCCLEPILDLDEVLESELVQARGMVVELDQPGIGPVKQVGASIKLSRTPADTSGAAPALGGDTDAVLREIGIDPGPLRDEGVV
jgi:alpha-methylacyl-CoA racemase